MFKAIQYRSSPADTSLALSSKSPNSTASSLFLFLSLSLFSFFPLCSGLVQVFKAAQYRSSSTGYKLGLELAPQVLTHLPLLSFSFSLSLFLPSLFRFLRVQLFKAIQYRSSPVDTSLALSSRRGRTRSLVLSFSLFSPSLFLSSLSFSLSLCLSLSTLFFSRFLRGWCKCLRQPNTEAAQRDISLALS